MQTHTFTHRGATLHYQTGGAADAPSIAAGAGYQLIAAPLLLALAAARLQASVR